MNTLNLELRGVTPLLMKSNVGVNPLHPLTIAKKKISGKRKKTEEDNLEMMMLDWELGLYWNDEIGAFIPAQNVEASLRDAAKSIKKGKDITKGVFVFPDMIKLEHPGPKDYEALKNDQRYRDIRVGKLQGKSSIMICRPRFDRWSCKIQLEYDPSIFDEETILHICQTAGKYVGLCDYRPRYGKFEVIVSD